VYGFAGCIDFQDGEMSPKKHRAEGRSSISTVQAVTVIAMRTAAARSQGWPKCSVLTSMGRNS